MMRDDQERPLRIFESIRLNRSEGLHGRFLSDCCPPSCACKNCLVVRDHVRIFQNVLRPRLRQSGIECRGDRGISVERKKWLAASCLLGAIWMALASVGQLRAEDLQVEATGWRPKWQPAPIGMAADLATVRPAGATTPATHADAAAAAEEEPFDWRDDLYGGPGGGGAGAGGVVSTPLIGSAAVLPSQPPARCWCQCRQSDPRLCGHCGLPRPVQAAYREGQPAVEAAQTILVDDELLRPPLDRLRLAVDRVQQTLGKFY